MASNTREAFHLWRCLPDANVVKVGVFALEQTPANRISRCEFRYDADYLASGMPAIDPRNLPLTPSVYAVSGDGFSLPGFLDDALPDAWGRKVVAWRLTLAHVDTLTLLKNLSGSGIGALQWTPASSTRPPVFAPSAPLADVQALAEMIWQGNWKEVSQAPSSLQLLWQAGSGVGGVRPKALVHFQDAEWLLKFNQSSDAFNHANIEHACLQALQTLGISAPDSRVITVGQREALLVKRFDTTAQQGRYHLMTANAFLKNPVTLADADHASYENIADIVRKYSCQPQKDLEQLFTQLLVNGLIKNTDDHLRNFSFLQNENGWRLSPAYDVLPVDGIGQYHQITFDRKPWPPTLDEAAHAARVFGLGKSRGLIIADNVRQAFGDIF